MLMAGIIKKTPLHFQSQQPFGFSSIGLYNHTAYNFAFNDVAADKRYESL